MKINLLSFMILGVLFLLDLGCSRRPTAPTGPAPEPAHPAMRAPPGSSSPETALPPDHPVVPPPAEKGPSQPPIQAEVSGRDLTVGPVALTAPEGWTRMAARPFTLAVFGLPLAEGDPEDGQITVSLAGGGYDGNIARWQGQFKEKPPAQREEKTVSGMKAVTVTISGTFTGGGGPMMKAGDEKPGWKMWGSIIEIPGLENLLFLKATGPENTLTRWNESLGEFLNSLRKVN